MCRHKCICHTAADDQRIYLVKKVIDHGDLGGNLRSAENSHKGPFRIVYCISKEIDLFLHQIAYYSSIHIPGYADIGTVCPVSGPESIVDKHICQRGKIL